MTDDSLVLSWPGGQLDADPAGPVTLGRDPDCTIPLNSAAVSRHHGQISFEGGTWTYTDLGSTQGSYADGSPIQRLELRQSIRLTLGQGPEAVVLELKLPAEPPSQAMVPLAPTQWAGGRVVATAGPPRPNGATGFVAPTVVRDTATAPSIRVGVGGDVRTLQPGARLTVGREPDNDLVLNEDSVSRHHLVVEPSAAGWMLRDLGSSAGTWEGETRVNVAPLAGSQSFRVGDRQTGPLLSTDVGRAAPTGSRVPRRRRPLALVIAAAVIALALLAGGGVLGVRALTRTSAADLARGTVKITVAYGDKGKSGSGTIIDKKQGLILTNAHVAAFRAPGFGVQYQKLEDKLEPEVKSITISVTEGLEKTAEPRFIGTVVAVDGYLDLAVVKITQTLSGAQVDADDLDALTQLTLGDSDQIDSGDGVRVVGYPGVAQSDAPTLTRGVVSGVTTDPRLKSNRAYFNTDARINAGNSGGLAADDAGHVIGVPTLGLLSEGETSLYAFRPVNFAKPLIAAVHAGTPYTSPWVQPAPAGATVSNVRFSGPANTALATECTPGGQQAGLISVAMDYTGFGGGEHSDLLADLDTVPSDGSKPVTLAGASTLKAFPTALPDSGCLTLTFVATDPKVPLGAGNYRLTVGLGASLHTVLSTTFTYAPQ